MAWKLACGGLGALMLVAAATATGAQASEATALADRAGFLLGHAQRCGVAEARLQRSVRRMNEVIAAFAADGDDRETAQTQFGDSILAGALARLLGDPLPSCAAVRSTLAEFERHRHPVNEGEGQMARDDHSGSPAARRTASSDAKAAKRSSTSREELSAERRAALELRRAAQQTRGKPPSI